MGPRSGRATSAVRFPFAAALLALLLLAPACFVTPKQALKPELSGRPAGKLPLTAALIFPQARLVRVWRPDDPLLQWGRPKDIPTGRILHDVTLQSLSFIFERAFAVENENEAGRLGANLLIFLECQFTFGNGSPDIRVTLKADTVGVDGRLVTSLSEKGKCSYVWSPINDGTFHNALVDAFEKMIPVLLESPELWAYARELPALIARMRTASPKPAPKLAPKTGPAAPAGPRNLGEIPAVLQKLGFRVMKTEGCAHGTCYSVIVSDAALADSFGFQTGAMRLLGETFGGEKTYDGVFWGEVTGGEVTLWVDWLDQRYPPRERSFPPYLRLFEK